VSALPGRRNIVAHDPATAPVATVASAAWSHAPTATVRRWALWVITVAEIIGGWGLQWDIEWHIRVGRDSFWIPPHLMVYAGVAGVTLVCFGILARSTWRRGTADVGDEITVLGLTGTPGFHLAAWGITLTVLSGPLDDLWHRLFGLDITVWSPPHLLGLFGSFVNTAACLRIADEVYPAGSFARTASIVLNGALLLRCLGIAIQPAFVPAFIDGGVSFHLLAILGALLFPLAYLPVMRLLGRAGPLLVLLTSAVVTVLGAEIARVGFAVLQPVSTIEELLMKQDPRSPIAVAHALVRTGDEYLGLWSAAAQAAALTLPVLVLLALDARRRPVMATICHGMVFMASMGWVLSRTGAFGPMTPGVGPTLVALLLTITGSGIAAVAGRRLATFLST